MPPLGCLTFGLNLYVLLGARTNPFNRCCILFKRLKVARTSRLAMCCNLPTPRPTTVTMAGQDLTEVTEILVTIAELAAEAEELHVTDLTEYPCKKNEIACKLVHMTFWVCCECASVVEIPCLSLNYNESQANSKHQEVHSRYAALHNLDTIGDRSRGRKWINGIGANQFSERVGRRRTSTY